MSKVQSNMAGPTAESREDPQVGMGACPGGSTGQGWPCGGSGDPSPAGLCLVCAGWLLRPARPEEAHSVPWPSASPQASEAKCAFPSGFDQSLPQTTGKGR